MVSRRKHRRNQFGDVDRKDRAQKSRAHKDRKRWCGGHPGRDHTPEVVINHNYEGAPFNGGCKWLTWNGSGARFRYSCRHSVRCSTCLKYLTYMLEWEDCPLRDQNPRPMLTNSRGWTPSIVHKVRGDTPLDSGA